MVRISLIICFCTTTITLAAPPLGIAPTALSGGESLQAVIDRGGPLVFVPQGTYLLTSPLLLRSGLTILFEPGTEIAAAEGAFKGKTDSLIQIASSENVTMIADGAVFKMRKADLTTGPFTGTPPVNAKGYVQSEFRACLEVRGSKNVTIQGGTFADCGGDGISLLSVHANDPTYPNGWKSVPNANVTIRRVTVDNAYRNGVSPVACYPNCLMEDSVIKNTIGTSPQASVDCEPEPYDQLDMTVRRCRSENARGPCFMMSVQHSMLSYKVAGVDVKMPPIRIVYEDNECVGLPPDQPMMRMTGVFNGTTEAPTGYLRANLPIGTVLQWNDLIWKK